jgi:hypothetical protein
MSDVELFRTLGGIAGLAGLSLGVVLVVFLQIAGKSIFPTLTRSDAYRLLVRIINFTFGIGALGIVVWFALTISPHRNQPSGESIPAAAEGPLIVAGTVVDQATNMGIGQATIMIEGQASSFLSEDNGNFRIVLTGTSRDPVRVTVTKDGYLKADQSVTPPTHTLILQMRPKLK